MHFEEVAVAFAPLIKGQIKQLKLYKQHDDYYQEGMVALWEAYRKFDAQKGCFEAYAKKTVRGFLLTKLRNEQKYDETIQLHDDCSTPAFGTLTDEMPDSITPYLENLSPRERLWVNEAILLGKKTGEIALERGVSVHTVGSWRKSARKKLRLQAKTLLL